MSFQPQNATSFRHQTRDYDAPYYKDRNAHTRSGHQPNRGWKHSSYNSASRGYNDNRAQHRNGAHSYIPAGTVHANHRHPVQSRQYPPLPQAPPALPTLINRPPSLAVSQPPCTFNDHSSRPGAQSEHLSLSAAQRTYAYAYDPWPKESKDTMSNGHGRDAPGSHSHTTNIVAPMDVQIQATREDEGHAPLKPDNIQPAKPIEPDYRKRIRAHDAIPSEVNRILRQYGSQSTFDLGSCHSVRVQPRAPVVAKEDEKSGGKKPPVLIFPPSCTAQIGTNKPVKDFKINKVKKVLPGSSLGLGGAPEEEEEGGNVPAPLMTAASVDPLVSSPSSPPPAVTDKGGNRDAAMVKHKRAKKADDLHTQSSNLNDEADGSGSGGAHVRDISVVPIPSTAAASVDPLALPLPPPPPPSEATLDISTKTQTNKRSGSTLKDLKFKKRKKAGDATVSTTPTPTTTHTTPTTHTTHTTHTTTITTTTTRTEKPATPIPIPTPTLPAHIPSSTHQNAPIKEKGKDEVLARERGVEPAGSEGVPNPPQKKKKKKKKKREKEGEESSTNGAMVENDARGGGSGKEEGGEKKKRGRKRKSLAEEGEGGEQASGSLRKKMKKVKREDNEGEEEVVEEGNYSFDFDVGGGGGGAGSGERYASGKKKRERGAKAGSSSTVQWSLVSGTDGRTGKPKPKTKSKSYARRVPSSSTAITLGTHAPSPAQILRPTIWAASRSELVLVLPELGHSRSYSGITEGSSNYPMVLLDDSTAEGVGIEILHQMPAVDREVGEYPSMRLTLRREFICAVDELPVENAGKDGDVEEDGLEYIDVHPAPPAPPPAPPPRPAQIPRIPHVLPPEVDILTASRGLSYPIILISSKEVFNQAFSTPDQNTNARVGLADEHAYVFWGFFRIKTEACVKGGGGGGRLVAACDIEGEGEGEGEGQDKRRVRGVVEWVFDVEWASGAGVTAKPWWADVFPSRPVPVPVPDLPYPALLPAQPGLHPNLHLNLVPTQLADGQEEGSADECMPRGWLCKKCGRLNPKAMMRHRWCGSVWAGCKDDPVSGGYAVHVDDARDPRQTPLALPINVWDENRVEVRVADWDDGMRTVKYRRMSLEAALARRNRENDEEGEEGQVEWTGEGGILKHVFTCNAEDLQREATPLFARVQEEVCLSKKMGDSAPYFKCDISDKYVHTGGKGFSSMTWGGAPQCVRDARELMEFMGRSYGEDGGFAVDQMSIRGWVSSGTRKASERVAGTLGTVGMLCLGNDVILTIMPLWIVGAEEEAVHRGSLGVDTETMSVTLVHGDMLLFSGCDFEYSIKRLGTSLLLVGGL